MSHNSPVSASKVTSGVPVPDGSREAAVGQRVTVVSNTRWQGQVAKVLDTAAGQFRVDVNPGPVWFFPNELEPALRDDEDQ